MPANAPAPDKIDRPPNTVAPRDEPRHLSNRSLFTWALCLTIVLEILTCILRFGLHMESTRDTASTVGRLTCGLRIHHGYIGGLLIILAACLWKRFPTAMWWGLVIGLGLLFSDFIHHFLILWPIIGSPEFDLTYPEFGH